MSTNALATKANICDAALALLRQDSGYSANAAAAAKCDNVWNIAWTAVANAHGWNTPLDTPSDTPPTDPTLRSLLVYALARELAIPVTGRQEDLKTIAALFDAKVRDAAIQDIANYSRQRVGGEGVGSLMTKEIALLCCSNAMKEQNAPVPHSTAAFVTFINGVRNAALYEVKKTLDISATGEPDEQLNSLNALASSAVKELTLSRVAATLGLSDQFAQLHAQLYAARVAEHRKITLNDALADNNVDPILLQLVANFRSDDAALVNAFTVYTQRVSSVKSAAAEEVCSHYDGWTAPTGTSVPTGSEIWYGAYEALVKAKLALVMGHDANAVAAFDNEYKAKLGAALKLELDNKLKGYAADSGGATGNRSDILYQLLQNLRTDDPSLLYSFDIYDSRVEAVDEQSCDTVRDLLGITAAAGESTPPALTGAALDAAVQLSCAKLAPVFGLDPAVVKIFNDRYLQLLGQAKRDNLDEIIDGATGTTATEPFASALAEVKRTLRIGENDTVDALALACAKELCAANNAEAYGYDGEYAAKRLLAYKEKILQYRKLELDDAMKTNTDPVLALLVSNFKGDDAALINAFDTYTARITSVSAYVSDVILSRHHWAFARKTAAITVVDNRASRPDDCVRVRGVLDADDKTLSWDIKGDKIAVSNSATQVVYTSRVAVTNWPKFVYSAYVAAVAAEIAQSIVTPPEAAAQAKAYLDKLAAERLEAARVADLNEDGSGSAITLEVKNVIKAQYRVGDKDLDESATQLASRIRSQLEPARLEVLAAHNWSFARFTMPVVPYEHPGGPFAFTRPADALRISSVRAHDGHLVDYNIDGQTILCREPPATVTYVRDSAEVDDFPPLVRRALVYRLASDFAVAFPQRSGSPETLLALYREKLAAAAAADARESNPGRSAWGRSTFADAMRGSGWRGSAHARPYHR